MLQRVSRGVDYGLGTAFVALPCMVFAAALLYVVVYYSHPMASLERLPGLGLDFRAWDAASLAEMYEPIASSSLRELVGLYNTWLPAYYIAQALALTSMVSMAWWPLYGHPTRGPSPSLLLTNLIPLAMLLVDFLVGRSVVVFIYAMIDHRTASAPGVPFDPTADGNLALLATLGGLGSLLKTGLLILSVISAGWGLGAEFIIELKRTYKEEFSGKSFSRRRNKSSINMRRVSSKQKRR
ncbi:uncharacterized protein AMSG_02742 [Thecamonas trahens ATCC 50062]|uniref:Uncharacterized protein n=1 Tax=Thecamonas trahens ATCC 50062 TaxID=461836 RepID=A0A0L0D1Q4_THETB|nr:hypothetical protein AMSG_02742 [Thecamonas trahens ATCC 50062]KNC46289.1 hypothetical protein AMSG_02742 [Thecamonas trahens ATCC 50062]|eukprot:XP_013760583.1 hypothetical protein AMSG_02742 [Thecamonas trahens ATCC 50062]